MRPSIRAATAAIALVVPLTLGACAPGPSAAPSGSAAAGPSASVAPSARPDDPAGMLRIAAPFVLDDAFPEIRDQLLDVADADPLLTSTAVAHVTGDQGESAFLVASARADEAAIDIEDLGREVATAGGTGTAIEEVAGTPVVVHLDGDAYVVTWLEPPFVLHVYAADRATAMAIAQAVLAGG